MTRWRFDGSGIDLAGVGLHDVVVFEGIQLLFGWGGRGVSFLSVAKTLWKA